MNGPQEYTVVGELGWIWNDYHYALHHLGQNMFGHLICPLGGQGQAWTPPSFQK